METLLPSEVARLVLGYLQDNCEEAAAVFLEQSSHLSECLTLAKQGKNYTTKVMGNSLIDLLEEYCAVRCLVAEHSQKLSGNDSEQFRQCGSLFQKLKFLIEGSKSGQTVLLSITVPSQGSASTSCSTPSSSGRSKSWLQSSSERVKRASARAQGQESRRIKNKEERTSCEGELEATPLHSLPGLVEHQEFQEVATSAATDVQDVGKPELEITRPPSSTTTPKRKGQPSRKKFNTSPNKTKKQYFEETVFQQALLENKQLHEKIAENINRVIGIPGEGSADSQASSAPLLEGPTATCDGMTNELDQAIKAIMHQTEQDPVFERVLEEILGPVEEDMSSSPGGGDGESDGEEFTARNTPSPGDIPLKQRLRNARNRLSDAATDSPDSVNCSPATKEQRKRESLLEEQNAAAIRSIITANLESGIMEETSKNNQEASVSEKEQQTQIASAGSGRIDNKMCGSSSMCHNEQEKMEHCDGKVATSDSISHKEGPQQLVLMEPTPTPSVINTGTTENILSVVTGRDDIVFINSGLSFGDGASVAVPVSAPISYSWEGVPVVMSSDGSGGALQVVQQVAVDGCGVVLTPVAPSPVSQSTSSIVLYGGLPHQVSSITTSGIHELQPLPSKQLLPLAPKGTKIAFAEMPGTGEKVVFRSLTNNEMLDIVSQEEGDHLVSGAQTKEKEKISSTKKKKNIRKSQSYAKDCVDKSSDIKNSQEDCVSNGKECIENCKDMPSTSSIVVVNSVEDMQMCLPNCSFSEAHYAEAENCLKPDEQSCVSAVEFRQNKTKHIQTNDMHTTILEEKHMIREQCRQNKITVIPSPTSGPVVNLSKNNVLLCNKDEKKLNTSKDFKEKLDPVADSTGRPRQTPVVRRPDRLSLSTPRRRANHVRALDFSTPPKIANGRNVRRRSSSAPRNTTVVGDTLNSSPKSDSTVRNQHARNVRSVLFKSPDAPSERLSHGYSPPKPVPPAFPIATRSPAPKLSGGWDKFTGAGLIIGSMSPSPSSVQEVQAEPVSSSQFIAITDSAGNEPYELGSAIVQNPIETHKTNDDSVIQDDMRSVWKKSILNYTKSKEKKKAAWDADLRAIIAQDFDKSCKKTDVKGNKKTSKKTKKKEDKITEEEARLVEAKLNESNDTPMNKSTEKLCIKSSSQKTCSTLISKPKERKKKSCKTASKVEGKKGPNLVQQNEKIENANILLPRDGSSELKTVTSSSDVDGMAPLSLTVATKELQSKVLEGNSKISKRKMSASHHKPIKKMRKTRKILSENDKNCNNDMEEACDNGKINSENVELAIDLKLPNKSGSGGDQADEFLVEGASSRVSENTKSDSLKEKIVAHKQVEEITNPGILQGEVLDDGNCLLPVSLETPRKANQINSVSMEICQIPMTPRVMSPHASLDTPISNFLRHLPCTDLSMIPTPNFPPTPNIAVTPQSLEHSTPALYSNRDTDYSSCSSYYKPSHSPSVLEQVLIDECSRIESAVHSDVSKNQQMHKSLENRNKFTKQKTSCDNVASMTEVEISVVRTDEPDKNLDQCSSKRDFHGARENTLDDILIIRTHDEPVLKDITSDDTGKAGKSSAPEVRCHSEGDASGKVEISLNSKSENVVFTENTSTKERAAAKSITGKDLGEAIEWKLLPLEADMKQLSNSACSHSQHTCNMEINTRKEESSIALSVPDHNMKHTGVNCDTNSPSCDTFQREKPVKQRISHTANNHSFTSELEEKRNRMMAKLKGENPKPFSSKSGRKDGSDNKMSQKKSDPLGENELKCASNVVSDQNKVSEKMEESTKKKKTINVEQLNHGFPQNYIEPKRVVINSGESSCSVDPMAEKPNPSKRPVVSVDIIAERLSVEAQKPQELKDVQGRKVNRKSTESQSSVDVRPVKSSQLKRCTVSVDIIAKRLSLEAQKPQDHRTAISIESGETDGESCAGSENKTCINNTVSDIFSVEENNTSPTHNVAEKNENDSISPEKIISSDSPSVPEKITQSEIVNDADTKRTNGFCLADVALLHEESQSSAVVLDVTEDLRDTSSKCDTGHRKNICETNKLTPQIRKSKRIKQGSMQISGAQDDSIRINDKNVANKDKALRSSRIQGLETKNSPQESKATDPIMQNDISPCTLKSKKKVESIELKLCSVGEKKDTAENLPVKPDCVSTGEASKNNVKTNDFANNVVSEFTENSSPTTHQEDDVFYIKYEDLGPNKQKNVGEDIKDTSFTLTDEVGSRTLIVSDLYDLLEISPKKPICKNISTNSTSSIMLGEGENVTSNTVHKHTETSQSKSPQMNKFVKCSTSSFTPDKSVSKNRHVFSKSSPRRFHVNSGHSRTPSRHTTLKHQNPFVSTSLDVSVRHEKRRSSRPDTAHKMTYGYSSCRMTADSETVPQVPGTSANERNQMMAVIEVSQSSVVEKDLLPSENSNENVDKVKLFSANDDDLMKSTRTKQLKEINKNNFVADSADELMTYALVGSEREEDSMDSTTRLPETTTRFATTDDIPFHLVAPSASEGMKALPPKKRKASTDDLSTQVEKKAHTEFPQKQLLKRIDVDHFLTFVHDSENNQSS